MLSAFHVPLKILHRSLAFGQVWICLDFTQSTAIRESQSISIFMCQGTIEILRIIMS